jgi:hypothetical protein
MTSPYLASLLESPSYPAITAMHGRATSNTASNARSQPSHHALPQASRIYASLAKDYLLPKTWFERVISFIDVPQDLVSDRAVSLLKERSKVA